MWKLYYHGQTTFSSNDGDWIDAPAWGVMGLAYVDDWVGWSRRTNDFYILAPWMNGEPMAVDHWGLMDYMLRIHALDSDERLTSKPAESLEMAGVKFGRSIADDEWNEVKQWMDSDPELPRKSARYRYERP